MNMMESYMNCTAALYKNDLQSSESEINQKEDEKTVSFGIRTFGDDGHGHLSLNGRRIFLEVRQTVQNFQRQAIFQWKRSVEENFTDI